MQYPGEDQSGCHDKGETQTARRIPVAVVPFNQRHHGGQNCQGDRDPCQLQDNPVDRRNAEQPMMRTGCHRSHAGHGYEVDTGFYPAERARTVDGTDPVQGR